MLRFLTPSEPWRGRVASMVSLPGEWPATLVEIFHADDCKISMTCALGVPRSSLKAFLAQGACTNSKDFRQRSSGSSMRISHRSKRNSREKSIHLRQR